MANGASNGKNSSTDTTDSYMPLYENIPLYDSEVYQHIDSGIIRNGDWITAARNLPDEPCEKCGASARPFLTASGKILCDSCLADFIFDLSHHIRVAVKKESAEWLKHEKERDKTG